MESIAMGPGAWDALPEQMRRTFTHNAPTWLDDVKDPTQGILDIGLTAEITVPVMLTGGGRSTPEFPAVLGRLAAALPRARRYTFADSGHVPHWTNLDEFAGVVLAFLDVVTTTMPGRHREELLT